VGGRGRSISESELAVLEELWGEGPSTVRALHERLVDRGKDWAYTTVQTLLQRLANKKFVACDRSGHAHVFRASLSRDELLEHHLGDLADRFCGGASTPLMLTLIKRRGFSSEEVEELRSRLSELDDAGEGDARWPEGGDSSRGGRSGMGKDAGSH